MMEISARILVVEEEEGAVGRNCLSALSADGHDVAKVAPGEAAMDAIQNGRFDVAMLGVKMPGYGLRILRALRRLSPQTEIVVIAERPSLAKAKESIRLGALDYVTKPFGPEALRRLVEVALACKPWKMQEE
jgi:DNA-binding NtrC family response regulator